LGENNIYVGLSQNISEGGVFIATHRTLPIGTVVLMSFSLPRHAAPISVVGVVRWVRGPEATVEHDASQDGPSVVKTGMGVQFMDLDEESASAIRDFTRWRSPEFFD